MTRHEASPYATVMDDSQLTGRPIVLAGAGPYGGDLEVPEPLVTGGKKWADVDRDICMHAEQFPTKRWWIAFAVALAFLGVLVFALITLFYAGMGILGVNQPVGWGSFIINFVFWIGIGHAGTLISAVLFLFRQQWRTGINRAAEAMTLFAVACAGIFPIIHLGRAVVRLLARAVPERPRPALGELQLAAGVGHLRHLDLRPGLAHVLVRRAAARPGHRAGPGDAPVAARRSTTR